MWHFLLQTLQALYEWFLLLQQWKAVWHPLEREETALSLRTALSERKLLLHTAEAILERKKGFGREGKIFWGGKKKGKIGLIKPKVLNTLILFSSACGLFILTASAKQRVFQRHFLGWDFLFGSSYFNYSLLEM